MFHVGVSTLHILMTQSKEETNMGMLHMVFDHEMNFRLFSECLSNLWVSVLFLMHSLQAVMNLIIVICV